MSFTSQYLSAFDLSPRGIINHLNLLRRGVADLNGTGEAVGGIVVMRHGENALNVIKAVEAEIGVREEKVLVNMMEADEINATIKKAEAALKAAQAKLEVEFTKREKELLDNETRLKSASDRFEKDTASLGESERLRRQRDLVEQDRELQRKRREFQEDLNQRKNEELAAVIEKANKVIKQIFDNEKYDLILQDTIHFSARVDITKKVIDALNAQK